MKMRLSLAVLTALFLAWCAAAQTIEVTVKSPPGAPLEIINPECSFDGNAVQCKASVKIPAIGRWTAFGTKWKVIGTDGRTMTSHQSADRSMAFRVPTLFQPGEEIEMRSGTYFMAGRKAEVELEFAIPAEGETWGNTASMTYLRLMDHRESHAQGMAYFRSIYDKVGLDGLLQALREPKATVSEPLGSVPFHFRSYMPVFSRLRMEYERRGVEGLLKALGVSSPPGVIPPFDRTS